MRSKKNATPTEAYTLDTSALLALWNDEPGAGAVEEVLRRAQAGEVSAYYSFMTAMELYYGFRRRHGEYSARELYESLSYLPAERIWADGPLLIQAAEIKSENRLSVADAWVAATAMVTHSTLVHKDPEFEALEGSVKLKALPYKA